MGYCTSFYLVSLVLPFFWGVGVGHRQQKIPDRNTSESIDSLVLVCMSQPGDTSSTGSLRKVLMLRTSVLPHTYGEKKIELEYSD